MLDSPGCLLQAQLLGPHLGASESADGSRAREPASDRGFLRATSLRPEGLGSEHLGGNLRRQIKSLNLLFQGGRVGRKAEDFKHNRNFVFSLLLIKNRRGPKETPSGVGNEVIMIIIKEQNGNTAWPGANHKKKKKKGSCLHCSPEPFG